MKDHDSIVTTTGTVDRSGARKVGLDPEGIGALMSLLSNQYVNKYLAALREYLCNGWDSHIVSGNTHRPVLVTLPSDMQPSLLIQDFGLGLAENEMIDIFGTYLRSTKKKDDDTTGNFGIGSKSAWSMGQQFIVTGVKDGIKTVALFSVDDDGVGECDIIRSEQTDEDNGVLISLAVPDVDAMQEAAAFFFETVDRGVALVNGEEPTPIFETDQVHKVNDQTYTRVDHTGTIYLVMGQVPYEVDRSILRLVAKRLAATTDSEGNQVEADPAHGLALNLADWSNDTTIYFRLPIGSVTVHPSRERLRDTNRTVDALTGLVKGLHADLTASVQKQVDEAPSLFAAAQTAQAALVTLDAFGISRKNLLYKGQKIRKTAEVDLPNYWITSRSWRSNSAKILGNAEKFTVDVEHLDGILVIAGVPEGEEGKVTRYLKRYLQEGPRSEGTDDQPKVTRVFVANQPWGVFDWFAFGTESGVTTITLEEFKAELKSMRAARGPRTVNEPSYTVGWNERASKDIEDRDTLSDIVDMDKPVVIYHEYSRVSQIMIDTVGDDVVPVVLLPQQSEDALLKRLEAAGVEVVEQATLRKKVVKRAKRLVKAITADERAALEAARWVQRNRRAYGQRGATWVHDLRSTLGDRWAEIKHDGLQEIIDTVDLIHLVAEDIDQDRRQEIHSLAEFLGDDFPKIGSFDYKIPEESEILPMTAQIGNYRLAEMKDDVVLYVNARGRKA